MGRFLTPGQNLVPVCSVGLGPQLASGLPGRGWGELAKGSELKHEIASSHVEFPIAFLATDVCDGSPISICSLAGPTGSKELVNSMGSNTVGF